MVWYIVLMTVVFIWITVAISVLVWDRYKMQKKVNEQVAQERLMRELWRK